MHRCGMYANEGEHSGILMERRRCARKGGGSQPQWSNRRPLIEIERVRRRATEDSGGFILAHADEQARKKQRVAPAAAPPDDDEDWFDPDSLPNDAEVALDFLRPKQAPRLVLVHHVPGVLKDRGAAERELRALAAQGKVTYLQLPTASSDVAVLGGDEYRDLLASRPAFAAFALAHAAKLYCSREELEKAGCLEGDSERVKRAALDDLRRLGFLRPRRGGQGQDAYWFAVPQGGDFARDVLAGRAALANALACAKYKEVDVSRAVPSLDRSPLGQAFHVRDLVGRGDADLLERPAGRFLRLRRR